MTLPFEVAGPYFEDLTRGQEFSAPGVTLTAAHAAIYQATFGDRLMLPLDSAASCAVTGSTSPLAHPLLVINMAIGQSTWASQRVKGNIGYRGLTLLRPVFIGDTLYSRTRVAALRRNQPKHGRTASGVAALEIATRNQHGDAVLHFWRLPMLACREEDRPEEVRDDIEDIGRNPSAPQPSLPPWRYDRFPELASGDWPCLPRAGSAFSIEARDTVTAAPEFVRLTLNMAMAHTDAASSHGGVRLVYGGHTISMCFAQLGRALPRLVTMLSWEHCDHREPVREGDRLRSELAIIGVSPQGAATVLTIHARCFATRESMEGEACVLDWSFNAIHAV